MFTITNRNNWDIYKVLPENDYEWPEDLIIPLNYGLGIKAIYNENYNSEGINKTNSNNEGIKETDGNNTYTAKYHFDRRYPKPTVVLKISTWKGISFDAIHLYGNLEIRYPEFENDKRFGYTIGNDLPIFKTNKIYLNDIIEQWQKDKYKLNYEFKRVGEYDRGFFSKAGVIRKANKFINNHFEKGWQLKIDSLV